MKIVYVVLPTREKVIGQYTFLRLKKQNDRQHTPRVSDIYGEIAVTLEKIWNKSSILIVHRVTGGLPITCK